MKRTIIAVAVLIMLIFSASAFAQEKLAQTGFKFLSVVSDARAAAMADAVTSLQIGSSAMFFNPAGMSNMQNFLDVSVSNNQWIADIKHYTLGMAICPFKGDYGVMGFSVQYVDYGNFIGTIVNTDPLNLKAYDDVGIFKLYALAVGVGYANSISDRFSVGGQIRWARQDLGQSTMPNPGPQIPVLDSLGNPIAGRYQDSAKTAANKLTPWVFDFGTQFKTGVKSLVFGMSVRNFSKEIQYVYEQFQLPLVFTLGISMNLMDLIGEVPLNQSLYMSIDASHYRDHPEQLRIGLEYKVMNMLALRGGFVTNSDESSGLSFGVGVSQFGLAFDYSYTSNRVFNNIQRMTARFSY